MLFENTGDMRFAQRHFAPRVSSYNQRGAGCLLSVAGDVDGDGDIDVFIVHKMTTTLNTLTKGTKSSSSTITATLPISATARLQLRRPSSLWFRLRTLTPMATWILW